MPKNNANCPTCRGRGWYEAPIAPEHFAPRTSVEPCPECLEHVPATVGEVVALCIGFACLFALMLWAVK